MSTNEFRIIFPIIFEKCPRTAEVSTNKCQTAFCYFATGIKAANFSIRPFCTEFRCKRFCDDAASWGNGHWVNREFGNQGREIKQEIGWGCFERQLHVFKAPLKTRWRPAKWSAIWPYGRPIGRGPLKIGKLGQKPSQDGLRK